jgi:hypothetical protein
VRSLIRSSPRDYPSLNLVSARCRLAPQRRAPLYSVWYDYRFRMPTTLQEHLWRQVQSKGSALSCLDSTVGRKLLPCNPVTIESGWREGIHRGCGQRGSRLTEVSTTTAQALASCAVCARSNRPAQLASSAGYTFEFRAFGIRGEAPRGSRPHATAHVLASERQTVTITNQSRKRAREFHLGRRAVCLPLKARKGSSLTRLRRDRPI